MTTKPTTAAEALKMSKSGRIESNVLGDVYSFDETTKVWMMHGDDSLYPCVMQQKYFLRKEWLPYDPEPTDTELAEAQKLVGSWVLIKNEDTAFKVDEVARIDTRNNIHVIGKVSEFCLPLSQVEPFTPKHLERGENDKNK